MDGKALTEERSVLSGFGRAAQQLEDVGASGVESSDDGSSKSRPVNNSVVLLKQEGCVRVRLSTHKKNVYGNGTYLSKDTKKSDGNDKSTCNITFSTLVLSITNSGTGQEHEAEDDQGDVKGIRTIDLSASEGSESVQDSDEHNKTVPQGEGSMNKDAIPPGVGSIVLLQVV
jgi:hypothetical protein